MRRNWRREKQSLRKGTRWDQQEDRDSEERKEREALEAGQAAARLCTCLRCLVGEVGLHGSTRRTLASSEAGLCPREGDAL